MTIFRSLVLAFSACITAAQAWAAPIHVGNGGDAVVCRSAENSPYNGTYALDFLVTEGGDALAPVASVDDSLANIEHLLTENAPELAGSFAQYRSLVRNQTDLTAPRIWETAPFGLVDLNDENLVTRLPANCRDGERVQIIQAVVRQDPEFSGTSHAIIYKYVPQVFTNLARTAPVQLSFLIVHEWLWDFSKNVDRNRRINRYLHSLVFRNGTRENVRESLRTLGLSLLPQLVANDSGACFLRDGIVKCWGRISSLSDQLAEFAPTLPNATAVALSEDTICVANALSIECKSIWLSSLEMKRPPLLENVSQLAINKNNFCALHRNGITCWGESYDSPQAMTGLVRPIKLADVFDGFCAVDEVAGLVCWKIPGFLIDHWIDGFVSQKIRDFADGYFATCVVGADKASCSSPTLFSLPADADFVSISARGNAVCVLSSRRAVCQASNWEPMENIPRVVGGLAIATAKDFACVADSGGVQCWAYHGRELDGQLDVPAELRP